MLQTLAESLRKMLFENVYRVIYASQIRALKDLNSSATGLTEDQLRAYLPDFHTTIGRTFEQWLEYLTANGLVSVDRPNVRITDTGREFLVFLAEHGYSELGVNSVL